MARTMARYNPVSEMVTLHDAMDRLLADSFVQPFSMLAQNIDTSMPIDMYEENDKLIIKTPMPGVRPEDVNIDIQDNILTITGEVKHEEEKPSDGGQAKGQAQTKGQTQQGNGGNGQQGNGGNGQNRNWYMREREYVRYVRAVSLPFPVKADQAEATLENGVLTLQLPKAEEAKQKKIQVKAK